MIAWLAILGSAVVSGSLFFSSDAGVTSHGCALHESASLTGPAQSCESLYGLLALGRGSSSFELPRTTK